MPILSPIPRIHRLSSALANQIAAGEVVERPASVVKELVENSLDAGATRIKVAVSKSGCDYIRIVDNGHGIHPDDLELALQRHATAKLNTQSDLSAIHSLGFRGEALPSISSVADFTITSRIADREQGLRLTVNPLSGETELKPAAHPVGTTVEVARLFHNTPARKKFLRSERTEFLHIQEVVRRLALSRFNFYLQFDHNDRNIFSCRDSGDDLQLRVATVLGKTFTRRAIPLDHVAGTMRLWGWLGVDELARSSTDRQFLYLNGRMIHDRRLNHAIRHACEGQIVDGRFPSYVLHLEMEVNAADVNVHPGKHEVRFHQMRDVHDFLYAALNTALQAPRQLLNEDSDSNPVDNTAMLTGNGQRDRGQNNKIVGEGRSSYSTTYGSSWTPAGNGDSVFGQILIQVNDNFLVTKRDPELLLFDIDAAKRHIAKTRLSAVEKGQGLKSRPLLVPVSYEITEAQAATLVSLAPLLASYALDIELAGPGLCRVRTLPHLLADADIFALVNEILTIKCSDRADTITRQHVISILLRHLSDIPRATMASDELQTLMQQLQDCGLDPELRHCPPIWTSLDSGQLKKLIGHGD